MRRVFALALLLVMPALVNSQNQTENQTQSAPQSMGRPQSAQQHSTITGCLSSGKHGDYQLVDQAGKTNIVFSPTVHLDSYVGQSVTLVGDQDTSQSTDTGTSRTMPHFKVYEVQPGSGNCK